MTALAQKTARFDEAARRERLVSPAVIQPTKAVRHPEKAHPFTYKIMSDATGTGKYNCRRQKYTDSGWADHTTSEVVLVVECDSGHDLDAGDFLIALGKPNSNGEIPAATENISLAG